MKTYDATTITRLAAGEVDALIGIAFMFDSGIAAFFQGAHGEFTYDDDTMGTLTYYGLASLLSIDIPKAALTNEAAPITVRLFETYLPEDGEDYVDIFDDGGSPSIRESLDAEPWQGKEAIISYFWRDEAGQIVAREQVARRIMDSMPQQFDEDGRPIRVAILEREDLFQTQIEGRLDNADFQREIDPDDRGYRHAGKTRGHTINFGRLPEKSVKDNTSKKGK